MKQGAGKGVNGAPGTRSFKRLAAEVRACKLCADYLPFEPRPVFQVDPRARILIAGQAPGRKAHERGVPFDDPSGDRLRQWMGVDRKTFYDPAKIAMLPMGLCFPGKGKGGDLPPRKECAPAWRARLLSHLPAIRLTLVIGRYALDWHLPDRSSENVTDTALAWRKYWPGIFPTPHPSPRNQRWLRSNPWFEREALPKLRERIRELI